MLEASTIPDINIATDLGNSNAESTTSTNSCDEP